MGDEGLGKKEDKPLLWIFCVVVNWRRVRQWGEIIDFGSLMRLRHMFQIEIHTS
jgi:hypothetical protein